MALLDELRQGRTLVLSHVNADIDAMGCSIALAAMFPGVEVGAVESVSRGAQNLLQHFGGRYTPSSRTPGGRERGTLRPRPVRRHGDAGPGRALRADARDLHRHRPPRARRGAARRQPRYVCDPDSPSCAQLVHRLAREAGAQVNGDAAFALVAGIVADTERFRIAPNSAVEDALAILRAAGIELSEVIRRDGAAGLRQGPRSWRCSRPRSAWPTWRRASSFLAHTRVGAFEASAARHMVSMGADVALVVHEEGGTVSITARASRRALDAGFHLGDYMQRLAQVVGGSGGGHAGAAGFKAPGKVEDVEPRAVALAREMLRRLGQDQAQ